MRKWVLALAATTALSLSAHASAGTIYDLFATTAVPSVVSSFSIRFDDLSNDGLLQINEITSFSGMTVLMGGVGTLTIITCVPSIAGSATQSGTECFTPNTHWTFTRPGAGPFQAAATAWNYSLVPVAPAAVPLPPAFLLLGSAFGLISLVRWWRHRSLRRLQTA
jgi:hypothetical protein